MDVGFAWAFAREDRNHQGYRIAGRNGAAAGCDNAAALADVVGVGNADGRKTRDRTTVPLRHRIAVP